MSEPDDTLSPAVIDEVVRVAQGLSMQTTRCGQCHSSPYALYAAPEAAQQLGLKPEQIDTCPRCGQPPFDPPCELAGMRAYFVDPYIQRSPRPAPPPRERAFWRDAPGIR